MPDRIKKTTLIHLKLEYPFLISLLLFGVAAEVYLAVRPENAYIIEPTVTLLGVAAMAIRFPFSDKRLREAIARESA